jgi:hypothetical protein
VVAAFKTTFRSWKNNFGHKSPFVFVAPRAPANS